MGHWTATFSCSVPLGPGQPAQPDRSGTKWDGNMPSPFSEEPATSPLFFFFIVWFNEKEKRRMKRNADEHRPLTGHWHRAGGLSRTPTLRVPGRLCPCPQQSVIYVWMNPHPSCQQQSEWSCHASCEYTQDASKWGRQSPKWGDIKPDKILFNLSPVYFLQNEYLGYKSLKNEDLGFSTGERLLLLVLAQVFTSARRRFCVPS